jgi:hypothetical protein
MESGLFLHIWFPSACSLPCSAGMFIRNAWLYASFSKPSICHWSGATPLEMHVNAVPFAKITTGGDDWSASSSWSGVSYMYTKFTWAWSKCTLILFCLFFFVWYSHSCTYLGLPPWFMTKLVPAAIISSKLRMFL